MGPNFSAPIFGKMGQKKPGPNCPKMGQKKPGPKCPKMGRKKPGPKCPKMHQNWCIFFEKKRRKTLKKIACYDIKYIEKEDRNFALKNGGKTC